MKISNLREMTNEEITQKLHDSKEELFNLRFQQSMNRLENANKLKDVKKDIARMKTLLTERELRG
ncbi:MAG: 50S ribosomal protein L29 [Candidatus Cloacimonetes bacterium]|jgi:large subunit ribosomal protein L29|nr:50S ribosomal protein L29 [Candidatus Cloacimonadota bacterium]MBT5419706.1 50S ribosomal protein L29 [Candidatus Cloacimonadota bacterium]